MMKTNFTKGEWKLYEYQTMVNIEVGKGAMTICEMETTSGHGCDVHLSTEQKANAHLIAAAPDMYAMIESMSKLRDGEMHTAIDWILDNTDDLMSLLKKARGEQ